MPPQFLDHPKSKNLALVGMMENVQADKARVEVVVSRVIVVHRTDRLNSNLGRDVALKKSVDLKKRFQSAVECGFSCVGRWSEVFFVDFPAQSVPRAQWPDMEKVNASNKCGPPRDLLMDCCAQIVPILFESTKLTSSITLFIQ